MQSRYDMKNHKLPEVFYSIIIIGGSECKQLGAYNPSGMDRPDACVVESYYSCVGRRL